MKAKCPNCGEPHKVNYGEDKEGNVTTVVGFVDCPNNDKTYLVLIDDKPIDKSRTMFASDVVEHPTCVQCGVELTSTYDIGEKYYCANPECPNYSLVAVRLSKK
jgi:ssDNA-binding Zn-finger/Zn-ribbon topoisomerase 1